MYKNTISYYEDNEGLCFAHRESFIREIPAGIHTGWEMIFLESGDVCYMVGGKTYYNLGKNWLIITRPLEGHSASLSDEILYGRYMIHFREEDLCSDICATLPADIDVIDCNAEKELCDLFSKLDHYIKIFDEKTFRMVLLHTVEEILCNVKVIAQKPDIQQETVTKPIVIRAIRYIKNNIAKPIKVEEVAEQLHISACYLSRLFAKYLKISPKQYITSMKLTVAHRDLCDGQKATDVCEKYGFADYPSFYRQYTKYFGHKPSEAGKYRRIFGEQQSGKI